jgi:hypothetical protein
MLAIVNLGVHPDELPRDAGDLSSPSVISPWEETDPRHTLVIDQHVNDH